MSYFLDTQANIYGNTKLRKPQIEAYIKIEDYFKTNPTGEALVVLPTGTGKSGLISIAPFGVSKGRVLVVTPNLVTKRSIEKTQEVLDDNFWVNFDVLFNPADLPVINPFSSDISQQHLEDSHFLIINIQQTKNLMDRVGSSFFDMIIIDESHHSVASSWVNLLNYFKNVKVLHVTGTPYRGDNQEVRGEKIHETKLSEVMRDRMVKWLRKETVDAHELYFTIPSDPGRKLSKDDVLALKDKEWLEKSVAMSKECSLDVISHSIEKYKELKRLSSKVPHKILATGCSISHAEDIQLWYEESGMKSVIVHSGMEPAELSRAFMRIDNHDCQVVISVNMLMEGYDHHYLSILALFRPYRSQMAFAQVVGRVLRAIPPNEITEFAIDNNALIVYHKEIGLDSMWNNFQDEVNRAKTQVTKDYTFSEREYSERDTSMAGITASDAYVDDQSSYLSDIDFNQLFEQKKRDIEESVTKAIGSLPTSDASEDELEFLKAQLRKRRLDEASHAFVDPQLMEKRPAQAREQLRSLIKKNSENAVADLLSDLQIDNAENNLSFIFSRHAPAVKAGVHKNDATLVMFINAKLLAKFGPAKERSNEALLQALKHIPSLIEEIRSMIR